MAKNNEVVNGGMTQQQMMQQFKSMVKQSPLMRRALKEAEKFIQQKESDLSVKRQELQIVKDSEAKAMLGLQQHRNMNTIKVVDGVILRVQTDGTSVVTKVEPVKDFISLSYEERASLLENDKKLYKVLEMELYKPTLTDKVVNLMVLENEVQYAYFDIIADTPTKPNLAGLDMTESFDVTREYATKKADVEGRLNAYNADREAYTSGTMQNDRMRLEDEIKVIEDEIKGEL